MAPPWDYLLTFLGVKGGRWLNFWGGSGSAGLISTAGIGTALHLLQCHEEGCHWPGRFPTVEDNGHHYRRCKRHHLERHKETADA